VFGSKPKPLYKTLRHLLIAMAFVVSGVVLIIYNQNIVFFIKQLNQPPYINPVSTTTKISTKGTTTEEIRSKPIRLVIPSIKLDTTFVPPLGLNPDQTVSVPDNYNQVGWYSGGVTPGEIGSAVILGHVDSRLGPAVFYSLGQVKVGDEIQITRADNIVSTFVVTELKRYPQTDFPTEQVYGPSNKAVLRLVTCTGIFDRGVKRYSQNLVVYASLK
jgi:LPXTG-site transpeptidase (sortase) family protein